MLDKHFERKNPIFCFEFDFFLENNSFLGYVKNLNLICDKLAMHGDKYLHLESL